MAREAAGRSDAKPPEQLRAHFKRWQRASVQDINKSPDILDFKRDGCRDFRLRCESSIGSKDLEDLACETPASPDADEGALPAVHSFALPQTYELECLPGLLFLPGLLSNDVQITLLDKIVHRDLSNPVHQTNLHFHHDLPYDDLVYGNTAPTQGSFFDLDSAVSLQPKDPALHKPLPVGKMLRRKLRWVTLGGQYDWTRKAYPEEVPPAFPGDVAQILKGYFPNIDAQAAIINFYTPSDTLSIHRDISEECDRGLISISIGCDGIFLIANRDASQCAVLRLRSGDAVLMTGESRFAWHGVPRVLPSTCPEELQAWPHVPGTGRFENWHGWLASKRINLNVRQMKDTLQ